MAAVPRERTDKMGDYALITGNAGDVTELYSQVVRREGLEAVVVRDSAEARRIVSTRGKPKLVLADLAMSRDASFTLLREVQSSIPTDDRPAILASVSRELSTTARDLTDALGIAEVLPHGADESMVGLAVRRALTRGPRSETVSCPPPVQEEEGDQLRRARLFALSLIDEGPSARVLKELLAQTAEAFGVPLAVMSLMLDDTRWFEAYTPPGAELGETQRVLLDDSFCSYVLDSGQPVVVQNASAHPAFASNPLVRNGTIASGAGVPLTTPDGDVLGSLFIFDPRLAAIEPSWIDMLSRLAERVAAELDLRSKARSSALEVIRFTEKLAQERESHQVSRKALAHLESMLTQLDGGVMVLGQTREVMYANPAVARFLNCTVGRLEGISVDQLVRTCAKVVGESDHLAEKIAPSPGGLPSSYEIELKKPVHRLLRWSCKRIELEDGPGILATVVEIEMSQRGRTSGRYPAAPVVPASQRTRAVKRKA
jgi:GAF domain-containing protein